MVRQMMVGPTYEQEGDAPQIGHQVYVAAAFPLPLLEKSLEGGLGQREEDVSGSIQKNAYIDGTLVACRVGYRSHDGVQTWGWYDPAGLVPLKRSL